MKKRVMIILALISLVLLIILIFIINDFNEIGEDLGGESKASIGFIGCSNTRQTVQGYQFTGGENIWFVKERDIHEYDGGAVLNWAKETERENKNLWKVFDKYLKRNPNTKKIWWQLCIRKEEAEMKYEDTIPIIEALRIRIPHVKIYVSSLTDYNGDVCEITGQEGLDRGKYLVQELDSKNEDIFLGPVFDSLNPDEIMENDESKCHSNEKGVEKLGYQMKEFFEKENENIDNKKIEELSSEEKIWRDRIELALAQTSCQNISNDIPTSYYQGQLIDTHLHIPAIPDWSPEEKFTETPEGRFGGQKSFLGWNIKMSEIACTIKQEGTKNNFAFFPVYEGKISNHLLEIWNRTILQYPEQFTPFIMSSGNDDDPNGFPTVTAETLQTMLYLYPNLFEGYGEIGLYPRENGGSPELPPDSKRLIDIYPIIRKYNLVVYFHLGEGHKKNFEKVLQQNQDINFIWHGDQLSVSEIEDILYKYPNAYYGIDAFWGHDRELFLLFVGKSKENYMNRLNKDFDKVLNYAISDWKKVIERHPDQIIWGTDRGDAVWNYDSDLGQLQVKLARAFISKLDPNVQEKFAYKNAEKIINKK